MNSKIFNKINEATSTFIITQVIAQFGFIQSGEDYQKNEIEEYF